MIVLYFSGTGNSKFVAQRFASNMRAKCHSIEEDIDFEKLLQKTKVIAVCYPIYGSCVPRIMREFVDQYGELFQNKKLIILCTQMLFSGDGAKAFVRLLPGLEKNVIYAEHINMPNNICNLFFFPWMKGERRRKPKKAEQRIDKICRDLKKGKSKKRGWGTFSACLGASQNIGFLKLEEKNRGSFQTDDDCIGCGLCVKACPMKNLVLTSEKKVEQKNNCTLCYRCVNLCPKKAATVLLHTKPKYQYKGIMEKKD